MLLKIKELFESLLLHDTKTPPKFSRDFSSNVINFKYTYATCKNLDLYLIKMELKKDNFSVSTTWASNTHMWHVTITASETLNYYGRYYSFHPELKQLIDIICNIAKREYLKINRLDKIEMATKEVKIFKDILPKLEGLEDKTFDKNNLYKIEDFCDA